jgi:hypothetical protein
MPRAGSKRARRALPPSTTMRTSSMVSDVSAIDVASTSLRPSGSGPDRGALVAEGQRRRKGAGCARPGQAARQKRATRRISASPGRKARQLPSFSAMARRIRSARPSPSACRGRRAVEPACLHRKGAPLGGDHRRVVEHRGHGRGVERGGHHQDAQVGAQGAARLPGQRKAQIGVERAFVELVEDHRADAGQVGRVLHHARQDAFGHDLDPGVGGDLGCAPMR